MAQALLRRRRQVALGILTPHQYETSTRPLTQPDTNYRQGGSSPSSPGSQPNPRQSRAVVRHFSRRSPPSICSTCSPAAEPRRDQDSDRDDEDHCERQLQRENDAVRERQQPVDRAHEPGQHEGSPRQLPPPLESWVGRTSCPPRLHHKRRLSRAAQSAESPHRLIGDQGACRRAFPGSGSVALVPGCRRLD